MNDLEKLIDRLVKDGKTNTIDDDGNRLEHDDDGSMLFHNNFKFVDDDGNRLYPNLKEALNKSIKKQEQKKLKDKKFRKNLSDKLSNCLGLNNKKHNH